MKFDTSVRVYRNLHRHCFSVQRRMPTAWRVSEHVNEITLADATFCVSQAGRARVLRERKKNVHAYISGVPCDAPLPENASRVTYDPYRDSAFVCADCGRVEASKYVWLTKDGVYHECKGVH